MRGIHEPLHREHHVGGRLRRARPRHRPHLDRAARLVVDGAGEEGPPPDPVGTITTSVLVFIFTRRLALSVAVGVLEFTSKIGLFWLHERVWDRIRLGRRRTRPAVLWFTGLSGSGKSTISAKVATELHSRGFEVEHLDGDTIRNIFPQTGFTRADRDAHVRRVGYVASRLEQHGTFVVASLISSSSYVNSRSSAPMP